MILLVFWWLVMWAFTGAMTYRSWSDRVETPMTKALWASLFGLHFSLCIMVLLLFLYKELFRA